MNEQMFVPKERCEVTHTQTIYNTYNILLDGPIQEPEYYRDAYQVLRDAQQGDRVNIFVNSPGGSVDSAVNFINLIRDCEAEVVAFLEGETHSSASMIALVCHGVVVKPYCSMLVHNASFGTYNTAQNVRDHVTFTTSQTERLIKDVYKDFLSESEIEEVIRNREIWLSDEEIGDRLERMFAIRNEEEDSQEEFNLEELVEDLVDKALQKKQSLDNLTNQDQKLGLYDVNIEYNPKDDIHPRDISSKLQYKDPIDFELLKKDAIDKFNEYIEK